VDAVSKALDYKPADPVIETHVRKAAKKTAKPVKKTGTKPAA